MSNLKQTSVTHTQEPDKLAEGEKARHIHAHLSEIVEALQAVRNGYVQIAVQDGHIVQIDRMEKRRLR